MLYRIVRAILRALMFPLFRLEVRGLEHVPKRGPLLIVTNHMHWLDPPVVMVALPIRATVLVAEKWATRAGIGWLFRWLGGIFIERGEADRSALRKALAALKEGVFLGIAPEGTRSHDHQLHKGKPGVAYLATRSGAPLMPVVAYGQEKVFSELKCLRRPTVHVVIGPVFTLPEAGNVKMDKMRAYTHEIMLRLAALLPPEYRGAYREIEKG